MLQRSDTVQQLGFILKQAQYGLINRMLLFVPIAMLVGGLTKPAPVVFILNFLAILPLAASSILIVVIFTRDMGIWGGMLRAIFGNTTELAVRLQKMRFPIYLQGGLLIALSILALHRRPCPRLASTGPSSHHRQHADILSFCTSLIPNFFRATNSAF